MTDIPQTPPIKEINHAIVLSGLTAEQAAAFGQLAVSIGAEVSALPAAPSAPAEAAYSEPEQPIPPKHIEAKTPAIVEGAIPIVSLRVTAETIAGLDEAIAKQTRICEALHAIGGVTAEVEATITSYNPLAGEHKPPQDAETARVQELLDADIAGVLNRFAASTDLNAAGITRLENIVRREGYRTLRHLLIKGKNVVQDFREIGSGKYFKSLVAIIKSLDADLVWPDRTTMADIVQWSPLLSDLPGFLLPNFGTASWVMHHNIQDLLTMPEEELVKLVAGYPENPEKDQERALRVRHGARKVALEYLSEQKKYLEQG